MKRAFLRALLAQRPAIKRRWRALLERTPAQTPLASPELLVYLMDETLDELLLEICGPGLKPKCSEVSTTERTLASCGICRFNPYLSYYLSGEIAIVEAMRNIPEVVPLGASECQRGEAKVLLAYRDLSHAAVRAFCEVCRLETQPSSGVEISSRDCALRARGQATPVTETRDDWSAAAASVTAAAEPHA